MSCHYKLFEKCTGKLPNTLGQCGKSKGEEGTAEKLVRLSLKGNVPFFVHTCTRTCTVKIYQGQVMN